MPTILPAAMKKGQACGHSFAHSTCCVEARNTSLYPKNLEDSLGENNHNKGRQASWVSPSPRDLGGDPALQSLGSKSASPWHIALLALEECVTKELQLKATSHMFTSLEPDGHLVMLLDSFNQETLKSFELEKGLVDHDQVKTKERQEACNLTACRQTAEKATQTKKEQMQLDQARLQEGQRSQLTAKA